MFSSTLTVLTPSFASLLTLMFLSPSKLTIALFLISVRSVTTPLVAKFQPLLASSDAGSAAIAGAMLAQVITPVAISIVNSFLVEQLLLPLFFAISETTTYALRASLQITLNTLFIKNSSHINIIIYILYVTPGTCGNKLNNYCIIIHALMLPFANIRFSEAAPGNKPSQNSLQYT